MILFILYIAQNDSSVSISLGSVGLSRHVLGLSGISLLLRVVSHQRAHDGITWNVNNDDGEAPRLLQMHSDVLLPTANVCLFRLVLETS